MTCEAKKDNTISNYVINFDPRREQHRLVRDEQKEQFLETFATIRKSAVIFKSLESGWEMIRQVLESSKV